MSYIEQSITPGEKVIHIGRFHWIYMIGASMWLVMGLVGCLLVISAGLAWDTHRVMGALYPELPKAMFWQGFTGVIAQKGGYIAAIRDVATMVKLGGFGLLLLGIFMFAQMIVIRATTEIAVTSNRFVLKEGVVARNVDEMNINRIESVHVIQSVLGRILDYGIVMVRGMGIGEIVLPTVARPITLRNAIEYARELNAKRDNDI